MDGRISNWGIEWGKEHLYGANKDLGTLRHLVIVAFVSLLRVWFVGVFAIYR